jgi:hypothetical protein
MMWCRENKAAMVILVLAVLALVFPLSQPVSAIDSTDGWEWQNPLPQGNDLCAIWGSSPEDVFAVGEGGTILHYDGDSWSAMSSPTMAGLCGVWGSSSNDVFAVGGYFGGNNIFHYDGDSWSEMSSPTTSGLLDVWGSSSNDVFAVGSNGAILHYDGNSWSVMSSSATDSPLWGVWGSAPNDVFAVGLGSGWVAGVGYTQSTVLHYDGNSWSSMSSGATNDFSGVWGSSSNDAFAVGVNGPILHYTGDSWSEMSSPRTNGLLDVWGSSSNDVFAVGYGGTILHYDGNSWSSMSSVTTDALWAVWGTSSDDVFAVGGYGIYPQTEHSTGYGTIVHYDGNSWSSMSSGTTIGLGGVWGSSSNDVFAVGYGGTILHYDGNSWSEMSTPNTNDLLDVWGSSSNDVFVVGGSGILHYDGDSWSEMSISPTLTEYVRLYRVCGISSDDVFAIGQSWANQMYHGIILHYDGNSWSRTMGCGSASKDVFFVGGGRIFYCDGNTWRSIDTNIATGFNDLWRSPSNDVFGVGSGGTILHLADVTHLPVPPATDDETATEETPSRGVPVWVWSVVGLAAVAAGAGGFFLFLLPRRKAMRS